MNNAEMMSARTNGAEEQLIRLVHARPALYDATNKFYNHKATKAMLWRQIEHRLGISIADIKRRWVSLRTQYGRYVRFVDAGVVITGRQKWILNRLQFLEPHLKKKEAAAPANPEDFLMQEPSAAGSEAVPDGTVCIKTEAPSSPLYSATRCSTPTDEGSMTAEERKPFAPMEESSLSEADDTICRPPTEEPSPCASADLSPKAKRSKTQLDEPSSDDSTNLLRIISKTLETLASRGDPKDDISAFCRNLDYKMRKLPPHILPHFQHEVDTCLYRYQILTSYNQTGQTPGSP